MVSFAWLTLCSLPPGETFCDWTEERNRALLWASYNRSMNPSWSFHTKMNNSNTTLPPERVEDVIYFRSICDDIPFWVSFRFLNILDSRFRCFPSTELNSKLVYGIANIEQLSHRFRPGVVAHCLPHFLHPLHPLRLHPLSSPVHIVELVERCQVIVVRCTALFRSGIDHLRSLLEHRWEASHLTDHNHAPALVGLCEQDCWLHTASHLYSLATLPWLHQQRRHLVLHAASTRLH